MKYLDKTFSVYMAGRKYSEGWEKVFGKNKESLKEKKTFEEIMRKEIKIWLEKEGRTQWEMGYIRGLENALMLWKQEE